MKLILAKCPARVNLSLKTNKTGNFEVINDTVNIYDELEVYIGKKLVGHRINIVNNHMENINMVMNSNNHRINLEVIFKAINAFFKYTKIDGYGTKITLTKNIPSNIGLGGSYSDAAGIIMALNEYFSLNLIKEDLINIASEVHSNIPYFIYGGYSKVSNNGSLIEKHKEKPNNKYLLGISNLNINWDYITKNNLHAQILDTDKMYNCYEWMLPEELIEIKRILLEYKSKYVSVNGVSSSVVGIFNDQHERYEALEKLKKENINTITCKSCDGIIVKKKYK